MRLAVRRMLEMRGCEVVAVDNGRAAIEALGHEPFAAIVMDMQMPEMGGWEATVAIRQLHPGRGGRVPIIALTASSAAGDREICLAAGMDGYVAKSSMVETLMDEIDRVVRSASGGGGAGKA